MLHFYISPSVSGGQCPVVTPTVVIILDVVPDSLPQKRHVVLRVLAGMQATKGLADIDVLRLDGTPEALYPDIVLASSTSVHADLDAEPSQVESHRLLLYWLPWSELIISGAPWASTACRSTSMLFSLSSGRLVLTIVL